MSKSPLQLAKFLPAIIFALVPTVSILTGWLIGTNLGRSHPEIWVDNTFLPLVTDASSQAAGQGGLSGGLWGLIFGGFLSFGGFGLITASRWRKKYADMKLRHSLLLVLGWMLVPTVILLLMLWSHL